ncbi:MAG: hypothetical protein J1F43_01320 [Muribaculaceae bacterium]|nr:hypothetical protein [Muribaculaceae bacterium]
MKFKKNIFTVLFFATTLFVTTLRASADVAAWKLYPTFDEEVTHLVETPEYVYFTSMVLPENELHDVYASLFRYDKKGDELLPLSTSNILNSTSVRDVIYNPAKGYLAVLYKDYTIDLLYNNGQVVNIPFYRQSELTYPKNVNSMSIDIDHDRLYLATDFGYVAINDKKYEIAESRIYGKPLQAFCRIGDNYLAITDGNIITAPASSPRLSLDQYEVLDSFEAPYAIYPLNNTRGVALFGESNQRNVQLFSLSDGELSFVDIYTGTLYNIDYTSNGLTVPSGGSIFHFKLDGSRTLISRPTNYTDCAIATSNLSEVWVGRKRKGLTSLKKSGDQWSVTRDWMLPNSPATFATTSYVNHPDYGLLMLSHGANMATVNLISTSPMQLNGLKQGRWTNYSQAYTNPVNTYMVTGVSGMVVDPDNKNYVYISSYHEGILRLNLSNPQDIIHMGRSGLPDSQQDHFAVLGPEPTIVPDYWNKSAPYFDSKGNLWINFPNYNNSDNPHPHLYCWTAEDRKATTSAKNIRLPQIVEFDSFFPNSNLAQTLPLLKTGNGLLVHAGAQFNEMMALIDTNGTPTDMSDDKVYRFPEFVDSDGNVVDVSQTRFMWEDPSTGYVWVCHRNGVFYFVPSQVRQGNYQIYRLKVPRNDGTNLADYLLEGVSVNHLATDSEGRKWFATAGGGVICTSSDGREILEEFTMANSPLPDDIVFGIGYNSATNSLMFSTDQGYAEYALPVSSNSTTKEDVRAYPNPVRPDFSGYVTITDIPQGSFVKISDAGGNLVKELGVMSGFEILWDLSDANFNRVKSGVYYILISPSNEYSKYSTVGKILVMS